MAALQGPVKTTTTSTSTVETARGKHFFKIACYSLHEDCFAAVGKPIRSGTFGVGGYDWCLRYYPDGGDHRGEKGYTSIYLELLTPAVVMALSDFFLVNQETGLRHRPTSGGMESAVFTGPEYYWGIPRWKRRSKLAAPYLVNDSLVIECHVIVIEEPQVLPVAETTETRMLPPPSHGLSENLAKLLETQEGSDVTFTVEGEAFPAHRLVLAARSPVFKRELDGPMMDAATPTTIAVEDMQPAVFRALLHFIYTDSMPSMDDLDRDDSREMVKHLLVAADRYAVERLRLTCEGILRGSLNVDTVVATLLLAAELHCSGLKEACIEFIDSSGRTTEDVAQASQGYMQLKRSCSAVIADSIFERATKSSKIYLVYILIVS